MRSNLPTLTGYEPKNLARKVRWLKDKDDDRDWVQLETGEIVPLDNTGRRYNESLAMTSQLARIILGGIHKDDDV